MGISKTFFNVRLDIYYKKQNSVSIKSGSIKTINEIKEFLEKRKKK